MATWLYFALNGKRLAGMIVAMARAGRVQSNRRIVRLGMGKCFISLIVPLHGSEEHREDRDYHETGLKSSPTHSQRHPKRVQRKTPKGNIPLGVKKQTITSRLQESQAGTGQDPLPQMQPPPASYRASSYRWR